MSPGALGPTREVDIATYDNEIVTSKSPFIKKTLAISNDHIEKQRENFHSDILKNKRRISILISFENGAISFENQVRMQILD